MNELNTKTATVLTPSNFEQAMQIAQALSQSDMIPKDYQKKPGNILVAIQWGQELGLAPLQAMQNIAVINGRPSIWGDAMLGLVRGSGLLEYIKETQDANGATCTVKRVNEPEATVTFTIQDAKAAGKWGSTGPWTTYPKRMLQMRARSFALRDAFADVLKGLYSREEAMDIDPEDRPPTKLRATPETPVTIEEVRQQLPEYTEEDMEKNLPKWQGMVDAGKATPEKIINNISTKYQLTDDQMGRINALADEVTEEVEAND